MSWPDASNCCRRNSANPLPSRSQPDAQFFTRLISAAIAAGEAELLTGREWAILAGENDYTTDSFQQITGGSRRRLAAFLHEHRAEFV